MDFSPTIASSKIAVYLPNNPVYLLFVTAKVAKNTWKKLRDNHREALKRQKDGKSGQAAKNTRIWKYQKVMEFLVPYMQNRNTTGNYSQDDSQVSQESNPTQVSELDEDNFEVVNESAHGSVNENSQSSNTTAASSETTSQNTSTPLTRKRVHSVQHEILNFVKIQQTDREKRKTERDLRNQVLDKMDDMDHFFLSVCESTKKLPKPAQLRLKRKIFNLVTEEEELQIYNDMYASESYNSALTSTRGYTTAQGVQSSDTSLFTSPSSASNQSVGGYTAEQDANVLPVGGNTVFGPYASEEANATSLID